MDGVAGLDLGNLRRGSDRRHDRGDVRRRRGCRGRQGHLDGNDQDLAGLDIGRAMNLIRLGDLGNRNLLIKLQHPKSELLEDNVGGHQLGERSRIAPAVGVSRIEYLAGLGVDDNGRGFRGKSRCHIGGDNRHRERGDHDCLEEE